MVRFYLAVLEPSDDGFSVFFPDVPGCASSGTTLREAALNAQEALQDNLSLTAEKGDPVPDPSDSLDVQVDPDVEVACYMLVGVDLPVLAEAADTRFLSARSFTT